MTVAPLLILALYVAAIVDINLRKPYQVRLLPRLAWVVVVVVLPLAGAILWFTIGRRYGARLSRPPRGGTIVVHESPKPPSST